MDTDNLSGIPEHFHPIIEKYGREVFDFIMCTGLISEATQVLIILTNKHQSRGGRTAVVIAADAYNKVASAYAEKMGWDQPHLAEVEREIQLAHRSTQPVVQLLH